MKAPSVPPPTIEASVAVATIWTADDADAGQDHRQRHRDLDRAQTICDSRMPMPRPASTRSRSTSRMPAYVLVTMGGMPRRISAMTDGAKPSPPRPKRTSNGANTMPEPADRRDRPPDVGDGDDRGRRHARCGR